MIRLFFSFLMMVLLVPLPAWAIGIDLKKIPKVAEYAGVPQAEFEKSTKVVANDMPYNEELLGYEMRLPKDWTENVQKELGTAIGSDEEELSSTVLGILGRYVAPPRNLYRSSVVVEGQGMGYEISVTSWFVNFILINGFSLTALTVKSERELEALYVQVEKDQTFIVRTRAMINGNRLVMARYYLPQENYDAEKVQQAQVINSFKVKNPSDSSIELHDTYGFLDQSYFNYPKSWRLKEKSIISIERMSATLFQERKEEKKSILEGHFKIDVVSRLLKTTLPEEIERFRSKLKINNYTVGRLIEAVDYEYDPSIKYGKAQIYELEPTDKINMQSYELLVTVMQGDDYYYITSMITPSREQDYYSWARNMEAARVINESVRRFNYPKIDPNDPYYDYLKEEGGASAQPLSDVPAPPAAP